MRLLLLLPLLCCANILCAQIVNIEEMRISGTVDTLHWYGAINAAFDATKVQESTSDFHADVKIQYKKKRNIFLLLLNSEVLRAGDQDFVNTAFAHLRYNYKMTPKLSLECYVQQQSNRLLLMQSRSLAGIGLRRRIFTNDLKFLRLYLGSAYLFENNVFTENYGSKNWNRISNYLSFTLRSDKYKTVLNSTTYWQPAIGMIKNYRLSTSWSLALPIGKHLSFNTSFSYSVDRGLPQAAPLEVYNWQNGLGWQF
ncbi:MAG: DUF481 domain-containing protein [Bacteroidota bacterium]